jgi:hypothetical protein
MPQASVSIPVICAGLLAVCAATASAADTTAPTLRNWGFGARRGAVTELTGAALRATDAVAAASALTYTLVTAPTKGQLRRLGTSLAAGGTFTQADIDDGAIAYAHTAGTADAFDRLTVTVSDGANATAAHTLEISVGEALRVQKVGEARIGSVDLDGGVAEVVAFDAASRRLFAVNGATASINVLGMASDGTLTAVGTLRPSLVVPEADDLTSVACAGGLVAIAAGNRPDPGTPSDAGNPGWVFLYDAATGLYIDHVSFAEHLKDADGDPVAGPLIGVQPDMVTFTPSGSKLLVAIEGQPSQDYTSDPQGGVVAVDLSAGALLARHRAVWCGFSAFSATTLRSAGVRIFNDRAGVSAADAAADLEPEFIAVSDDGATAYVTCQENNAIAVLDLATLAFTAVQPLGVKDWSVQPLDASNEDGGTNTNSGSAAIMLANQPVRGLYQPDGIAALTRGGDVFLLTANEGDAREYSAYVEERRIRHANVILDAATFPTASQPNAGGPSSSFPFSYDSNLGRLKISLASGDNDGDGDLDELHAFGARSFSVWTAAGMQVWDSGSAFETFFATYFPTAFNVSHDDNDLDSRSDDKGPEPEGMALLTIGATTYAVIGLERQGGFFLYDVTMPTAPTMAAYYTGRHLGIDPDSAQAEAAGDLAPEGLLTIPAAASPTGSPLIVVGNEISGTVTVHAVVVATGDRFSGSGAGLGGGPGISSSTTTTSGGDDDGSNCGAGGAAGLAGLMLVFAGLRRRRG